VKPHLALWVCAALAFGATPALAFKNIEGCDVVAFAGKDSPVVIPAERWQAYRVQSEFLLGQPQTAAATDWRALGSRLVELQKTLLAPERGTKPYQDYLASDSCRVLAKLDSSAIQTLLGEVAQVNSEPTPTALERVTSAARTQIDQIERSARFRSGQDKTLFAAGYYCFVAAAIAGMLPPERQQTIALDSFGTAIPCRDIGRTG
jgi:hypothetical protein